MTYADHFKSSDIAGRYEREEYAAGSYNNLLTEIEAELIKDSLASLVEKEDPRLLDFACGAGRFLPELASVAGKVVGVDVSREMLEIASGKVPDEVVLLCVDVRFPEQLSELKALGEFDGGCSMRFILNAEREMAIDCLSKISNLMSEDAVFMVNNHSRTISHKAISALRNRVRSRRPVVGNTLSDKEARSLLETAGFRIVSESGYGLLGAKVASLIGIGRAREIEKRLPRWLLMAFGSHRMYSLAV